MAVTKSGTGTWDLGREDLGTGDVGTGGRGDAGRGDAEFAIYSFRWLRERYYMMESLPAD